MRDSLLHNESSTLALNLPSSCSRMAASPIPSTPIGTKRSSTIDPVAQKIIEFTRTDPGPALPTLRKDGTTLRAPTQERTCGKPDAQGHKLCIELNPPSNKAKNALRAPSPGVELVDWCYGKPSGKDYMSRTEACMKTIGSGTLIFTDTDPNKPALGTATFNIEQRIKTYPKKGGSGSNFAEFDQQIMLVPTHIDPVLKGVHMKWNVGSTCKSCVTSNIRWADDQNNPAGGDAYWPIEIDGRSAAGGEPSRPPGPARARRSSTLDGRSPPPWTPAETPQQRTSAPAVTCASGNSPRAATTSSRVWRPAVCCRSSSRRTPSTPTCTRRPVRTTG
ncbi:hypothetical protein [Streptomyces sp.]|uniref:hypothetical protein n=1 Tax=Streptomyces sp. TaxID=1931 RepID=UPI002D782E73|nr:hypothetical protein [Streptomyces sp.]HET6356503.1 hypothetical protein [Streptomyces sp.]